MWKLAHSLVPFDLSEEDVAAAKEYVIRRANGNYDADAETVCVEATPGQETPSVSRTLFALREARLNTKLLTLYYSCDAKATHFARTKHLFKSDPAKGGIVFREEKQSDDDVKCIVRVGKCAAQQGWPMYVIFLVNCGFNGLEFLFIFLRLTSEPF